MECHSLDKLKPALLCRSVGAGAQKCSGSKGTPRRKTWGTQAMPSTTYASHTSAPKSFTQAGWLSTRKGLWAHCFACKRKNQQNGSSLLSGNQLLPLEVPCISPGRRRVGLVGHPLEEWSQGTRRWACGRGNRGAKPCSTTATARARMPLQGLGD